MKPGLDRREFLRRLAAVPLAPLALRSAPAPAMTWTVDAADLATFKVAAGESYTAILYVGSRFTTAVRVRCVGYPFGVRP